MASGSIKKVVPDRGFGFIVGDDGNEYFFHRSALEPALDFETLNAGTKISFEVEQSPKGPRARRVDAAE